MQKVCRQCSATFQITESDLLFYEKVSPIFQGKTASIPPPTLCPQCRNQRRLSWRNDRTFSVRTCDRTKERFVSIYPPDSPFTVYKPSAWYSDMWDGFSYGRSYDLTRSFSEQFRELQAVVPRLGIDIVNCENSEYCNYCGDDKDCYLDIAGEANQNCYYNLFIKSCKDCTDCTFVYSSTRCYASMHCHNSYDVQYSQYLDDCSECRFCFDCKSCRNCLLSINLRNKQYYILNEPHTKEEYEKKLKELRLGSHAAVTQAFALWQKIRIQKGIYRDMYILNSENCIGNDIKNSRNCTNVFNAVRCEDAKYLYDVLDAKDCQDLNYSLYKPEVAYELCSTLAMRSSAFNYASHYCTDVFYCDMVNNSQHLFGCIGLNHQEYCILNKQYTKEEYEVLVPKIIEHMRKTGEWGEFFPSTLSPFAYNATVAQEYFPLTREDAEHRGYTWLPESKKDAQMRFESFPDDIREVTESVIGAVLQCSECAHGYKVIGQELRFYREMGIPLPRKCPDCRHRSRIANGNPRQLWKRKCKKCGIAIQTTYAPDRPESVYCEACYLQEVY